MGNSDVPNPQRRRSWAREIAETVVLTLVIFLAVRTAVRNFRVDGYSMMPNLHSGEYILVNKVDYLLHDPQRGDVVVFRAVPAGQPDRDYIKRVIGIPGDTVQVRDRAVFINHHRLREPYISPAYRETYTFGPARVPRNDFFVLGDNRNDSYDSSRWATPWLPKSDIIGKAWVSYWPLNDISYFNRPALNVR